MLIRIGSVLVVGSLFVVSAVSQTRKTDREHALLKGPIRKVVTEVAKLSDKSGKQIEGKRELSKSLTYDKDGRVIEMINRDPSDGHILKYVVKYDDKGKRTEKVYFINMTLISGVKRGNYIWRDGDYIYVTRTYKHDSMGNRIEETVLDPGGGLWYGDWFRYDSQGNMIETAHYNTEGWRYRWVYTLENKGVIVEGSKLKPDGKVIERESYAYEFDNAGNWTRRVTSRQITEKGKSFFVPTEVTYRTIEYY